MLKQLLTKSFLVAAGLCVGATSAWADETRTLVYSNDFETSSGWTQNGNANNGWTVNPGTTTANTFNSKVIGCGSADGDRGLYSPSFGIDADAVSVVDVEMKFKMDACFQGKSSGIEFVQPSGVTIGNGYISAGTPFFKIAASASGNGYWNSITVGGTDYKSELNQTSGTYENNSLNRNTTGIVVLNARFNFTTKETTFTLKKTDGTILVASTTVAFADNTATSLDKIYIHAGKSFGGVTIDDVAIYSVETGESYADYTVHFKDNNGATVKEDVVRSGVVGETVNANSADVADYYNGDYKYVYSSDGGGVAVAGDGSAELTVVYTKYNKLNYTVNAVDGSDNVLAVLTSGYVYEDANSATTRLPWNVLYNGTLYNQGSNSNTTSITSNNQTVKITYTATANTNVVSYTEGENISGGTWLDHASSSNGAAARALSSAKFATLEAGKYKVVARFVVGNGKDGDTYATNPITVGTTALEYDVPAKANTTYISDEFSVTEPTDLYVTFAGSSISGVDYIYILQTGVTKSISAAGWATYCSPYALDFSSSIDNLEAAYIVTGGDGSVLTTEKVTGTVAANTGLLLKGSEGTVTIPVVASGTDYSATNKLEGVTTETADVAAGIYVLLNGSDNTSGPVGFYKTTSAFTVGANTAYLLSGFDGTAAPAFYSLFDSETTRVNEELRIKNEESASAVMYDLQGRRVSQPKKGLYIVNGKKVVVK